LRERFDDLADGFAPDFRVLLDKTGFFFAGVLPAVVAFETNGETLNPAAKTGRSIKRFACLFTLIRITLTEQIN
jgi:hypothetical protein